MKLRELPQRYVIVRLEADSDLPDWAEGLGFLSITRTEEELSIICREGLAPKDVRYHGPWVCFQLLGPFDLALTGIGIRLVRPVSDAGIGFLFVTTFDTDYLLVKSSERREAIAALEAEGLSVVGTSADVSR